MCTHTPPLLLQCALSLVRSIHCGHSPKPSGLTHPAPTHPSPLQPLTSMLLFGVTHHIPHLSRHSCRRWQSWSISCPWREQVGGGGRRRRLGGPLEAERALYSAPSRPSLTQASSYSFPVVRRCPAVTAPPGVPGAPQPGHRASSGPGPHPVLTCCSWEHEEPHRPTHCGEAPLHHRQALTLLIPSFPCAPTWANRCHNHPTPSPSSPRCRAFFSQILSKTAWRGKGSSQFFMGAAVASFPAGGWAALILLPGAALSSLCPTLPA